MNLIGYTATLELQTQEFSLGKAFEPATKVTTEYSDRTLDTIFTIYDKDNKQLAVFTQAVMQNKGAVSDEELKAFFDSGYTQQQALETVLGVALATLCNYANNLAQTSINPELEPYA